MSLLSVNVDILDENVIPAYDASGYDRAMILQAMTGNCEVESVSLVDIDESIVNVNLPMVENWNPVDIASFLDEAGKNGFTDVIVARKPYHVGMVAFRRKEEETTQ